MDSMSPPLRPRSKLNSSRPCARVSLWTFRLAFALSSVWHTEGRSKMRKSVFALLFLAAGSAAVLVPAAAAHSPADDTPQAAAGKPRTMEEVINRVVSTENHMYGKMKEYTRLVETYIQNLKPDKELGEVAAGHRHL